MLVLSIISLSPHGEGVLFRAGVSLISHCTPALGLLLTICLTGISSSFAFIAYERVISSALTCLLQRKLLLCIFILVWYRTKDAFECIEMFLLSFC